MQYLRAGAANIMERARKEGDFAEWTWDEYVEKLRDQYEHPTNRELVALRKYADARQKPDQSVQQFVNHLDQISEDLAPKAEKDRTQDLLVRLSLPLQEEMT